MQGEVKKLKEELDKLTQNRSASSTNGANGGKKKHGGSAGPIKNKKGELVECFNCKGNHYKSNCPNQTDTNSNSNGSNSNGSGGSGGGSQNGGNSSGGGSTTPNLAGSGLTQEVDLKTSAAIKTKTATLPPREQIPDDAKHTVSVDGTVTAKYCRHCGKFVRGKKAHFTADCKLPENRRFAFQPRAAGNMASVPPAGSPSPSPAPPHEPSGPPDSHLIQCSPRTYYDFSNMSRLEQPASNLAVVDEVEEGFEQPEAEDDASGTSWLLALSKDYGEQ
jgi:hypothetical protein